jgi:hypothetical protein
MRAWLKVVRDLGNLLRLGFETALQWFLNQIESTPEIQERDKKAKRQRIAKVEAEKEAERERIAELEFKIKADKLNAERAEREQLVERMANLEAEIEENNKTYHEQMAELEAKMIEREQAERKQADRDDVEMEEHLEVEPQFKQVTEDAIISWKMVMTNVPSDFHEAPLDLSTILAAAEVSSHETIDEEKVEPTPSAATSSKKEGKTGTADYIETGMIKQEDAGPTETEPISSEEDTISSGDDIFHGIQQEYNENEDRYNDDLSYTESIASREASSPLDKSVSPDESELFMPYSPLTQENLDTHTTGDSGDDAQNETPTETGSVEATSISILEEPAIREMMEREDE